MQFFEQLKKLNIENWSSALLKESIPTITLELTDEEINALKEKHFYLMGAPEKYTMDYEEINKILNGLSDKLNNCMKNFTNGTFVKLGARSPKDSFIGYKNNFMCKNGDDALAILLDSERTMDDLFLFDKYNYKPHVAVRKLICIPEWSEFRVFIKNSKLAGISQYYYKNTYPEITQNADIIRWAIEKKIEHIMPHLPLGNLIVDFFVDIKDNGPDTTFVDATLVELNPYSEWTDPCMFDWSTDTFEKFEFRYVNPDQVSICRDCDYSKTYCMQDIEPPIDDPGLSCQVESSGLCPDCGSKLKYYNHSEDSQEILLRCTGCTETVIGLPLTEELRERYLK